MSHQLGVSLWSLPRTARKPGLGDIGLLHVTKFALDPVLLWYPCPARPLEFQIAQPWEKPGSSSWAGDQGTNWYGFSFPPIRDLFLAAKQHCKGREGEFYARFWWIVVCPHCRILQLKAIFVCSFSQEEVIPDFGLCLWRWDPWGGQISQPRHNLVNSHVVSRVRKVKSHFHSGAFDLAFKIRHHHLPIPLRTNITQSRFSALPRRMVHIRRNAARPGHKLLSPLFYLDISANANSRHPKTSQQSFSLPGWPQNYFNACQNQSDFSGVSFSTQNHIGRYGAPRTTSFVRYNLLSIVMRDWRHGILSSWMVTE